MAPPPTDRFTHVFVELIPNDLEAGVLYVSLSYTTVMHLCACGCGTKVASALDPTDYSIDFDGETISLFPSIGNWDFHCQSHYVIRRGKVRWMRAMSDADIAAGRHRDRRAKAVRDEQFDASGPPLSNPTGDTMPSAEPRHIVQRIVDATKAVLAKISGH